MADLKTEFTSLGKTLGAIIATLTTLWFFGEPFADDYIEEHLESYDERKKKEWDEKKKLRGEKISEWSVLADKMGVAEDEVQIELGKLYRNTPEQFTKLENIVNDDYKYNKEQRNKIIKEFQFRIPETTLEKE